MIKVQCGQVLVRALFWACRWPPACCASKRGKSGQSALWSLPTRTLILSWGPTLMTSSKSDYLPKVLLPNPITWGVKFLHMNLGKHNSVHTSLLVRQLPSCC
jgi:hypothetical protein